MREPTCWDLIERGEFAAACAAADRAAKRGSTANLRNKVTALLNLGEFKKAFRLSSRLWQVSPEGLGRDLIAGGVAAWLMGDKATAVALWQREKEAPYADSAGGMTAPLLIHFAATVLHDEALLKAARSRIRVLLRRRVASWPAPVGRYVLGLCSEEDMRAAMSHGRTLRQRQECVANFYVGAAYLHSNPKKAVAHMARAIEHPVARLHDEYYLAKGILKLSTFPGSQSQAPRRAAKQSP